MQIIKNKYEKNANKKGIDTKKGIYKNVPLLYLAWPGLAVLRGRRVACLACLLSALWPAWRPSGLLDMPAVGHLACLLSAL